MTLTTRYMAIFAATALAVAAPGASFADDAQQALAQENFLQADKNGDKALDRSEFRKLIDLNAKDGLGRADMVKRFRKYSMAFSRADANSDDLVTPDELAALAQTQR